MVHALPLPRRAAWVPTRLPSIAAAVVAHLLLLAVLLSLPRPAAPVEPPRPPPMPPLIRAVVMAPAEIPLAREASASPARSPAPRSPVRSTPISQAVPVVVPDPLLAGDPAPEETPAASPAGALGDAGGESGTPGAGGGEPGTEGTGVGEGGESGDDSLVGIRRITAAITPPVLVERVEPEYPRNAWRFGQAGLVVLECVIDADGGVTVRRVLKGHALLVEPSVDAVARWRYRPALLEGRPIAVLMTVRVEFTFE